jgi:hypothetical protein
MLGLDAFSSDQVLILRKRFYSTQRYVSNIDWLDLNWIPNQSATFLGTTSNQLLRITIMALKYLEYFGTCGHWLLTGVYTSAGESARAVDDWKDDDRVGFIPCLCCAAMSV